MKKLIILGIFLWLMLSWFASSVGLKADENDTAYSGNLLPNVGTTTSSKSNGNLDGVQSGSTGALTNNSTHNGFSITCQTQVLNACGNAFNGEIEGSHDLTLKATGSLVGVTGTDDGGNSHTSTQKKLDGGIVIENEISIQNCEWSGSAYQCGNSVGINDKYTLTIKVKNDDHIEIVIPAHHFNFELDKTKLYDNGNSYEDGGLSTDWGDIDEWCF